MAEYIRMLQKRRRVQIKGATIGRLWAIWLVLSAAKRCSESCVCKFLHLHFYCLPNCSFQFLNMAWNISFTLQNCYFKRLLHVFHWSQQFGNELSPSLPNRDPLAFQVTQGVHRACINVKVQHNTSTVVQHSLVGWEGCERGSWIYLFIFLPGLILDQDCHLILCV